MTVAQAWDRSARDGRALLVATVWGDYALWIVRIGEQFVLCDDSMTGHLRPLDGRELVEAVVARWRRIHPSAGNHGSRPPEARSYRKRRYFGSVHAQRSHVEEGRGGGGPLAQPA